MEIEIRDTRNGDWYWVNNIVLACKSISLADKAVYSALATFSGFQEIRPTFEMIAERCDVSIRTAKSSVAILVEQGFVIIKNHGHKGKANVYELRKSVGGCVKKCKSCTIKKKCKIEQEEVQSTTESSANRAPHIDIKIDNIDTSASRVKFVKDGEDTEERVSPFKRVPYSEGKGYDTTAVKRLRERAEQEMGKKFPNQIVQETSIKKCLLAGYSEDEIWAERLRLLADSFWGKKGVDFKAVLSQIGTAKKVQKVNNKYNSYA